MSDLSDTDLEKMAHILHVDVGGGNLRKDCVSLGAILLHILKVLAEIDKKLGFLVQAKSKE